MVPRSWGIRMRINLGGEPSADADYFADLLLMICAASAHLQEDKAFWRGGGGAKSEISATEKVQIFAGNRRCGCVCRPLRLPASLKRGPTKNS